MAAEVFLSPGGRALENWRTAFPGLACLADAGQADAVMAPSAPSRVWVDVALPGWGEAVRTLAARGATVVVLSALPEGEQAVQALEAGARGYCHACAAPGMLREVAGVVEHGGLWVGPELLARLVRATVPLLPAADPAVQPTNPLQALSAREREVAEAVAKGLSNKQVAQGLAITERTVKAHLASVFDKLAVRDRMQLALLVARARM